MRKNELRKIFADGKTVLNAWLAIANPFSAELMAHQAASLLSEFSAAQAHGMSSSRREAGQRLTSLV